MPHLSMILLIRLIAKEVEDAKGRHQPLQINAA